MSTDKEAHNRASTLIAVGELVILREGQSGTIEEVTLKSGEPTYTVRMSDGSRRVVDADEPVRARWYAAFVEPDTDWSGDERREAERRAEERRKFEPVSSRPDRRAGERRHYDRRRS